MFYSENLYYFLCSSTNPKLGKNLVPEIHGFFIRNFFISSNKLNLEKKQKLKQPSDVELLLLGNYSVSPSMLSSKTNKDILKNVQRLSVSVLMRLDNYSENEAENHIDTT